MAAKRFDFFKHTPEVSSPGDVRQFQAAGLILVQVTCGSQCGSKHPGVLRRNLVIVSADRNK